MTIFLNALATRPEKAKRFREQCAAYGPTFTAICIAAAYRNKLPEQTLEHILFEGLAFSGLSWDKPLQDAIREALSLAEDWNPGQFSNETPPSKSAL